MRSIVIFITALILTIPASSLAADARLDYVRNQLISSGISKASVDKLLKDKRLKLYSIKTVVYKAPNWKLIENKLYSQTSIQSGINYIADNKTVFEKAEKNFGIKKEILAGIIAIETDFGKNTGNYSTFNVIYSRMKQWPITKWKGQASELIAFSKYCLNSGLDCFNVKGSYAGAFGLVQFMPSSVLAYGIDTDNSGVIDLSKPSDAIPSAANFLIAHGWRENQLKALAGYYGSSIGYPQIVLTYASLLTK